MSAALFGFVIKSICITPPNFTGKIGMTSIEG